MTEEKEKSLTREDVERMIEENDGTAAKLDLSGKVFEEAIDLSGLDLHGIILKDARFPSHFEGDQPVGAKFNGSNLNEADLRNVILRYAQFGVLNTQPTHLEGANLRVTNLLNANFQGADLMYAKFGDVAEGSVAILDNSDLRDAGLCFANFKGCYFTGTKLEGALIQHADIFNAHLEEADWGNYKIGEENKKDFYSAVHYYRRLKIWYTQAGYHDTAAKFYYREKEAARKSLKWCWNLSVRHRLVLEFLRALFGYGESWRRVLVSIATLILLFAFVYFGIDSTREWWFFGDYLYFSAVSFTALGYGSWVQVTNNWIKGIGAFESLVGISMMALLLVTFVRKWTR